MSLLEADECEKQLVRLRMYIVLKRVIWRDNDGPCWILHAKSAGKCSNKGRAADVVGWRV